MIIKSFLLCIRVPVRSRDNWRQPARRMVHRRKTKNPQRAMNSKRRSGELVVTGPGQMAARTDRGRALARPHHYLHTLVVGTEPSTLIYKSPVSLQRSRIVMSSMAPKRATAKTSTINRATSWIGFRPGASLPVAGRGFSHFGSGRPGLVLILVGLNKSRTAGMIIMSLAPVSGLLVGLI